jgi:septum formation protein
MPHDHPTVRAWRKAYAAQEQASEDVVLAADTVVVLDNQPLNKPTSAAHAHAMLAALAGRTHTVYTGMCVVAPQREHPLLELIASEVTMASLTADQIAAYVATGEPLDKAGSYAIQGQGGLLVQQLVGSYTGVMGLPLPATWHLLTAAGLSPLRDPTDAYHTWLQDHQKEMLPCPPTLP